MKTRIHNMQSYAIRFLYVLSTMCFCFHVSFLIHVYPRGGHTPCRGACTKNVIGYVRDEPLTITPLMTERCHHFILIHITRLRIYFIGFMICSKLNHTVYFGSWSFVTQCVSTDRWQRCRIVLVPVRHALSDVEQSAWVHRAPRENAAVQHDAEWWQTAAAELASWPLATSGSNWRRHRRLLRSWPLYAFAAPR